MDRQRRSRTSWRSAYLARLIEIWEIRQWCARLTVLRCDAQSLMPVRGAPAFTRTQSGWQIRLAVRLAIPAIAIGPVALSAAASIASALVWVSSHCIQGFS